MLRRRQNDSDSNNNNNTKRSSRRKKKKVVLINNKKHSTRRRQRRTTIRIGTIWSTPETALTAVSLTQTGQTQQICFRNHTKATVVACWIGTRRNEYHHYYEVPTFRGTLLEENWTVGTTTTTANAAHNNNNVGTTITIGVTDEDHLETTVEGHAFIVAVVEDIDTVRREQSLRGNGVHILGAYRTELPPTRRTSGLQRLDDGDNKSQSNDDNAIEIDAADDTPVVHLVEIIDPMDPPASLSRTGTEAGVLPSNGASATTSSTITSSECSTAMTATSTTTSESRNSNYHCFLPFGSCCRPRRRQKRKKYKADDSEAADSYDDDSDNDSNADDDKVPDYDFHRHPADDSNPQTTEVTTSIVQPPAPERYVMTVRLAYLDDTPVDTTTKEYESAAMGGTFTHWPVRCEPHWNHSSNYTSATATTLPPSVLLACDLDHMAQCLPSHALTLLRDMSPTPVWVNRTLSYGPQCNPIVNDTTMCFHPDIEWLIQNGLHVEKHECVEIFDVDDYIRTRNDWGIGGVLLHEFCHAYHYKGVPNGYNNREIIRCYQQAMADGLYDQVPVKSATTTTTTARAYACTDPMEYFAELSTAFLGGIPRLHHIRRNLIEQNPQLGVVATLLATTNDDDKRNSHNETDHEELFNKWYPFNRKQLKEHDPRAYKMLQKIWKVYDDT